MTSSPRPRRWGPVRSLLALLPVLILAPYVAVKQHHFLPERLTDPVHPVTGLPQISERRILDVARHLSEDIGYRTVGTREHALADAWMVEQVERWKRACDDRMRVDGRKLECEVWRQQGSGSHRFDMMSKRLYKTYVDLSNVVVRLSDGTPEGKAHAVLVNAHLDSTLPSPGAADDALPVGVMLDCMRVLVDTPGWSPKHAIIFLFNNAEESLQDGSHLFSTQHPIASTVRAVINLEAAGTTRREILFQATSEEMIEAYSHVPRPFGTIFANDIFSSGIILSDTDFRQFEQYLNVTGLDMAIIGNSYLYHMRKDLVENIQPGVAQNMAENTLALLRYLSAAGSPIPTLTEYTRPSTVFFSYLGRFWLYSFDAAKAMYSVLFAACIVYVYATESPGDSSYRLKGSKGQGVWTEQVRGMLAVGAGVLGSVVAPNLVAYVMQNVLDRGMSWFANEYSAVVLYAPATLLGALVSQYLVGPVQERTVFAALLLLQAGIACAVQWLEVGSAALFFLAALPLFVALVLDPVFRLAFGGASASSGSGLPSGNDVSLMTYALGAAFSLFGGVLLLLPVVEFFVPLTGRTGTAVPADNIIATIVALLSALALPLFLPFAHRFGPRFVRRASVVVGGAVVLLMAVFALRAPFDAMHQKRLFVLHLENITTGERHLHIAAADGAPGYEQLVHDVADRFATRNAEPLVPAAMDDYNSDWDSLYPFSAFLTPYKVPLPVDPAHVSPWAVQDGASAFSVVALNDVRDLAAGTRSLTIQVKHPGLIWTVIAFDAHVLNWTLDDHPPDARLRHFVKEASFYGTDTWSLDLKIKLESASASAKDERLAINFIGLQESGMWPAKRRVKEQGGAAMALFEELDAWLEERTGGTVEALLMGCVAGVVRV